MYFWVMLSFLKISVRFGQNENNGGKKGIGAFFFVMENPYPYPPMGVWITYAPIRSSAWFCPKSAKLGSPDKLMKIPGECFNLFYSLAGNKTELFRMIHT